MSKWFDSKNKLGATQLERPVPIRQVSSVGKDDIEALLAAIPATYPEKALHKLQSLASMPPAARLARNLKTALDTMLTDEAQGPLAGLTKVEIDVLMALERLGLSVELRVTAEGLFNVYERYQLVMALTDVFRRERARDRQFWEV